MSLLHRLATEQQKAILLSTHDLELAIQICDNLWLLDEKRPMQHGTPEDLILCGAFEIFFNKKGITFDASTGRPTADKPSFPIAVEGDLNTVHWVGNALIRNGFRPTSYNESNSRIYCHSPNQISFFISGAAEKIKASSIAELISVIKIYKDKIRRINNN